MARLQRKVGFSWAFFDEEDDEPITSNSIVCKKCSKIDEWAVNHHRMVTLGYLGACLALTRSTSGTTKEEIEGLPEVKFFTTESYAARG
jgi:hypothetical protein